MVDVLANIYAANVARLDEERAREPYDVVRRRALEKLSQRRGFLAALRRAAGVGIVAEVKRASPSAGSFAADADPGSVARHYDEAGADAISVLTERGHFRGELAHLALARRMTTRPLLRKDFLWTRYQVAQSAAYGADCILLIIGGIDTAALDACMAEARRYDLDVLVEVHDEAELRRALDAGAELVGINNRDLRTLRVDLGVGERLLPKIPSGVFALSESGLHDAHDAARMRAAGARGFLIGEALMRASSPKTLIDALRSVA
jgi:indole-3-glycerol phosphate synthase